MIDIVAIEPILVQWRYNKGFCQRCFKFHASKWKNCSDFMSDTLQQIEEGIWWTAKYD